MEEICNDKYILIQFISSGRFGNVYKVYNKNLGIITALKIEKENDNIKDESLKNEIQNLIALNKFGIHNIPMYYDSGSCYQNEHLYMELELLDGDLKSFIKTNQINKNELYGILFELLYTLYEFRSINFEHRDIKTANIAYIINKDERIYYVHEKKLIINNVIQPIIIDFNHAGFTANRNNTLFKMTGINYVKQDLHRSIKVMNQLIKITQNLNTNENKNIKLFLNQLRLNDDASSTFIYDALYTLSTNFII